ncbi:MAG: hypothetical protein QM765_25075 [Myxococcales bacterium]
MTLPSKGSRRVRVGAAEYRWRIRKRPTYHQGAFEGPMVLAVQSCAEGAHSVLVVNLRVSRPDNWLSPHQTAVTPKVVREIVTAAHVAGWDPLGRRPFPFVFGLIRDLA